MGKVIIKIIIYFFLFRDQRRHDNEAMDRAHTNGEKNKDELTWINACHFKLNFIPSTDELNHGIGCLYNNVIRAADHLYHYN